MKNKSIKTAVLIPLLITLLLGFAILTVTSRLLASNIANRLTVERTTGASSAAISKLLDFEEKSKLVATAVASNFTVTSSLLDWNDGNRSQSRQNLLTYLTATARELNVDSFIVRDAEGVVVLRLHDPDNYGTADGSASAVAAMRGETTTAYSSTATMRMGLNTTTPVRHPETNQIIGSIAPLYFLHSDGFVDMFAEALSADVTIFAGTERVATTLVDDSGNRYVNTEITNETVINAVLENGESFSLETTLFGKPYRAYYFPITNLAGENIGMFFAGFSTEYRASALAQLTYILIGFSLLLLVIIGFIVFGIVSSKLKKLPLITAAAGQIALGDIDIHGLDEGNTFTKNEVILLERAFSQMIESFKKQAYILARIAEGDYTSKVEIRSDKDVINLAIEIMLKETLDVLNQVATAGIQVSDGSKEIAAGAQMLADGAAQQSATVEQLSASMSEMAKMTKENAINATRAAELGNSIKHNAEKGSRQMTDMIDAVREINQASQNISKVIKIIDDIAFQTNILALNAAVEAARAGQHGKGFAVVAEEVRNLAGKSAEAAKETGDMIQNSMEKAELGSRIAGETAASLEEIVSGIIESSAIVNDIARYSTEQSSSISEIDSGINQVATVVHQNSATAEESAAASAQMSSQSKVLEDLIMQFQLRDN